MNTIRKYFYLFFAAFLCNVSVFLFELNYKLAKCMSLSPFIKKSIE